jgi:hypothetical protein
MSFLQTKRGSGALTQIDVYSSNRHPPSSLSQVTVRFKGILKSMSFPNSQIYSRFIVACRIRFYFQICLNKTVADEFFADETRFRCIEFMPGTLTFWYNMQCIWCTNLTNINHVFKGILKSMSFPNSQIYSRFIAISLASYSEPRSNVLVPCHMIDVGQVCASYTHMQYNFYVLFLLWESPKWTIRSVCHTYVFVANSH